MLHNYNNDSNNTNRYLSGNLCNNKVAFMISARRALCVQQNNEDTDYNMFGGRARQRIEPF
jgi:hypothetical protein